MKSYTGVDSSYEASVDPEMIIDSDLLDLNQALVEIMKYLKDREFSK